MFRSAICGLTLVAAALRADASPRFGGNFTVAAPAIRMLWVAPGKFLMTSTHGSGDDTWVTITHGYWLGRTEITQEQWQAVMSYIPLPSRFKGSDLPVEHVGWDTAVIFCQRLAALERAAGQLPPGYTYNLPTEAQWEYACRAGTTGSFVGELSEFGWYEGNSGAKTHPVAQKRPNDWGFYDMHGNVSEWCYDWYAPYPGRTASDPAGPAIGQFHVMRGGTWDSPAGACRSSFRYWSPTNGGTDSNGFRIALAPLPQPRT